ncbi:MAG: nitroreductase family protein [Planctomycetota bacterium]|jgi:nitroreductase
MDYDSFLQFAKSRRSIREFSHRKLTHSQIERLIKAACWAPSNHNRQGWKFIVFEDPQEIRMLSDQVRKFIKESLTGANRQVATRTDELVHFAGAFDQAPVVILVMHKKSLAIGKSILSLATSELASGDVLSTAMACQNLLLAAHAMSLGACLMTAPLLAGEVWKSLDDLPAGFEPTCLIALGYPVHIPTTPKRRKLEHVIDYRRGTNDRAGSIQETNPINP